MCDSVNLIHILLSIFLGKKFSMIIVSKTPTTRALLLLLCCVKNTEIIINTRLPGHRFELGEEVTLLAHHYHINIIVHFYKNIEELSSI